MMPFRQFVGDKYWKNDIPVSDEYNQDKMNLDHLVYGVEKHTQDDHHKRTIDVKSLVNSGKLKATQTYLSDIGGGGDPVFDHLRHPVVAETGGVGHILDGHHRLARAYKSGKSETVHWIKVN